MIMPRGQPLLLPVKPVFIWSSLLLALALNMLQNMGLWGRVLKVYVDDTADPLSKPKLP